MKQFLSAFCLFVLLNIVVSNRAYAQLPFEPFSAYPGNPVVPKTPGAWDQSAIWWGNVIVVNDTFYLTYNGTDNFPTTPVSIGLAVSSDGLTFSKSISNPIISADGSGFDAYQVESGALFMDNSTWYIYYSGRSVSPSLPSNVIGRATSNISPHGPWTRSDDTLLTVGSAGEWDSEFIIPSCTVKNGAELIMYYFAGSYWPGPGQIGMATSLDGGATWEKYDDPSTTSPPFAESDPVLRPDKPYDNFSIYGCTVLKTLTGWEMLYAGDIGTVASICYALSVNGINWVKDDVNNPIFVPSQDPLAYYDLFEKPAVVLFDDKYFMYYDYGVGPNSAGIGLATSSVVIPVELISFTASASEHAVTLNWSTATELNNLGFEIQRKTLNGNFATIGFVEGHGTSTQQYDYTYVDKNLDEGKYFYRLKQIDFNGEFEYTNAIEVDARSVDKFTLEQNYPNPFNPTTKIKYSIPQSSQVIIKVYDVLGSLIETLVNEEKSAGTYEITWNASNLPSGVYFYRIQVYPTNGGTGNFIETKKLLFLK